MPMNCVFASARRLRAGLRALPWLALLACAWLLPGKAMADNTCWIDGNTSIAFGSVNGGGGTTMSTLRFICQNDGPAVRSFRVCLYMNPDQPTGVNPRRLTNWSSGDYLNYNTYADAGMSQAIGSTTSGNTIYSTVLTTSATGQTSGSMPIYGRVTANQNVTAGDYFGFVTDVLRMVTTTSGTTVPAATQCATPTTEGSNYTPVTANFANTCYISAASDMDFGSFANLTTAKDATSTISLRCPTGTAWQLALSYGSNASGTTRRMAGPGGNFLTYQLYRDSVRSLVWGNSTTNDLEGSGTNAIQNVTVYGRVPAQTVGSAGTYSDTVTITLTY